MRGRRGAEPDAGTSPHPRESCGRVPPRGRVIWVLRTCRSWRPAVELARVSTPPSDDRAGAATPFLRPPRAHLLLDRVFIRAVASAMPPEGQDPSGCPPTSAG